MSERLSLCVLQCLYDAHPGLHLVICGGGQIVDSFVLLGWVVTVDFKEIGKFETE